jgi:cathepsin L
MAEIQEKYLNLQPEYLTQIKVQASLYGQSNSYSLALKPTVLTALNGTPTSVENYNYDWRGSLVSSVKNQGICGACWAFAGTADIETSYILKYRLQIDLSEQQLVDCSRPYGNSGCGGGMMNNAFQYVVDNGLTLESYYPYQQVARNCKYDPNVMPHFSIKGSIVIERDCNALAGILKQRPVSVVISANPSFIFYQKGILNSCGKNINHALQLVGMVKNYEESYYIGKNSWGVAWGMKGYVFIDSSEEAGNLCSVCEFPQYPI